MLKRTKPPLTRRSCVANSTESNGAGMCWLELSKLDAMGVQPEAGDPAGEPAPGEVVDVPVTPEKCRSQSSSEHGSPVSYKPSAAREPFSNLLWASIWSCMPCNRPRPSNCWPHSVAWLVHHCLPRMTASQTLVLDRGKPLASKLRASGPGAVCKVEWKPLAAKWLKDRQAMLHTDSAKSYASKIKKKRMRRAMYVSRRASKVGGLWYIFFWNTLTSIWLYV